MLEILETEFIFMVNYNSVYDEIRKYVLNVYQWILILLEA